MLLYTGIILNKKSHGGAIVLSVADSAASGQQYHAVVDGLSW